MGKGDERIIDFRKLPTVFDRPSAAELELVVFLERIVQAATAWWGAGETLQSALPCRATVGKRRCAGRLRVRRSDASENATKDASEDAPQNAPGEIRWDCPRCRAQGAVTNWEGADPDLSARALEWDAGDLREAMVGAAEYDELLRLDFPGSARVVGGATLSEDADEGGILLLGRRSEFDDLAGWLAGEANHAKPGRRQDLLDSLYEAVESAT